MLQTATKIIHEDVASPEVRVAAGSINLYSCIDNFWHYRIVMNSRLKLRNMSFPRSLAIKAWAYSRTCGCSERSTARSTAASFPTRA
jgi:hypothetical protein